MRSNRLNENEHLRLQTASSRQVDALFSTLAMELMHLRLPGDKRSKPEPPPKAVRFHDEVVATGGARLHQLRQGVLGDLLEAAAHGS